MNRVGLIICLLCSVIISSNVSAGICPATTLQQESSEVNGQTKVGKLLCSSPFDNIRIFNLKGQEKGRFNRIQLKNLKLKLPSIRRIYNTISPRDYNCKTVATYKSLGINLLKIKQRGKNTYMLFAAPPLARDKMSNYVALGKEQFRARGANFIFGFKMKFKLAKV